MRQLLIRNEPLGMIWQVYTVTTQQEIDILKRNASGNGFHSFEVITLDVRDAYPETFPGWNESDSWKKCLLDAGGTARNS